MYSLQTLPCALPTLPIPEFIDLAALSGHLIKAIEVLSEDIFTSDAIWRDSFALTGTLRTFYSAASVTEAWNNTTKTHHPIKFAGFGDPRVFRTPTAAWVDMGFTFETTGTPATTCSGFLSVVPMKDGKWKIWMMRTILEQLKGQPNVDACEPVSQASERPSIDGMNGEAAIPTNGISHSNGERSSTVNGVNGTNKGTNSISGTNTLNSIDRHKTDFDCVVVGGGQAGLSTGGRLKALGISYVILEKYPNVGDNWKTRYDSTKCKFNTFSSSPIRG